MEIHPNSDGCKESSGYQSLSAHVSIRVRQHEIQLETVDGLRRYLFLRSLQEWVKLLCLEGANGAGSVKPAGPRAPVALAKCSHGSTARLTFKPDGKLYLRLGSAWCRICSRSQVFVDRR